MNTRTFALIWGLLFLAAGVAGFIPGLTHPAPADYPHVSMDNGYGALLGLFPTNILHNVIHLLFGAWGLYASRSDSGAVTFAKGVAVIYVLLVVLGLIAATNTTFGLIPIFGNDVWLHAILAIPAAYFGFVRKEGATM